METSLEIGVSSIDSYDAISPSCPHDLSPILATSQPALVATSIQFPLKHLGVHTEPQVLAPAAPKRR